MKLSLSLLAANKTYLTSSQWMNASTTIGLVLLRVAQSKSGVPRFGYRLKTRRAIPVFEPRIVPTPTTGHEKEKSFRSVTLNMGGAFLGNIYRFHCSIDRTDKAKLHCLNGVLGMALGQVRPLPKKNPYMPILGRIHGPLAAELTNHRIKQPRRPQRWVWWRSRCKGGSAACISGALSRSLAGEKLGGRFLGAIHQAGKKSNELFLPRAVFSG